MTDSIFCRAVVVHGYCTRERLERLERQGASRAARGDASIPALLHTTPAPTATACPSKVIHMWVTALATLTLSSLILEIFLVWIIADVGAFLFQVSFIANHVIVKIPLPELIHTT